MKRWLKRTGRRHAARRPSPLIAERLEERALLAATITAPASVIVFEDTAKAISGISFTSDTNPVTVTLSVSHGSLTLSTTVASGLTAGQISFNGTSSVTISANVSAVNATLANASGLTYKPNANFADDDSLAIKINNGVDGDVVLDPPVVLDLVAVNDAPTFAIPSSLLVAAVGADLEKEITNFATLIKPGPDAATDEAGQSVSFIVTTNNDGLFAVLPTIDAAGTLRFTLAAAQAPDTNASAVITVRAHDNGGIANGGTDTSSAQSVTLTAIGPVNPVYNSVAGAKLRAFVINDVLTVQANGIPFVTVPSAAIESLTFNGGPKNDEIDLSGLTDAAFPILTSVKIKGGAGNDRIVGSLRSDSIDGGSGNDTLTGGLGDDTLIGNAGKDLLVESADADLTLTDTTLTGGLGDDRLLTIENASLTGGDGGLAFDASEFTRGPVTLTGGAGNDTLTGGSKNDAITGRDGDDVLAGGGGNDTLLGGFGNDDLSGDAGKDLLIGGFDDDVIDGGSGRDTAAGGQGGAARGGDGVADAGDVIVSAEVINETLRKLYAFE